jgi:hypothetical protein
MVVIMIWRNFKASLFNKFIIFANSKVSNEEF